jgi:hypothetical protein
MDEQQDKPGFRVTDRRRFTDSGETRDAAATPASAGDAPASSADAAASSAARSDAEAALEPVSFSTFVLGLSTQALLHLGEIQSPLTGKTERDMAAAKHVIDILGILRDKTRNNLERAEEQLLETILYDLRLRYVELVRAPEKKKEEA